MRAELEARLPEWSAWAQEHPGTLLAGAGVATAALAGLLLLYRRR
jgi:LPXTG-motif cell wall-anchored protein